MEKHRKAFEAPLQAVIAESGCCSEKNLLYLKENGNYYNMTYGVFEDEH